MGHGRCEVNSTLSAPAIHLAEAGARSVWRSGSEPGPRTCSVPGTTEQDWNETVTVTHVLSLSEPVRHGSPIDDRCAYCAGAVLCHGAATDASSGTGRLQPPVMNLRHGAHLHALLSLLALPLMSCHQGAQKRACERVGVALVECSCVCRCEGAMRVCPNWDQRSPCSGCIHSKHGVRGHAWTLV